MQLIAKAGAFTTLLVQCTLAGAAANATYITQQPQEPPAPKPSPEVAALLTSAQKSLDANQISIVLDEAKKAIEVSSAIKDAAGRELRVLPNRRGLI